MALGTVGGMGAAELVLDARVLPLGSGLSQFVYRCYADLAVDQPVLGVRLYRPDFEIDCSSHGYDWHHRSDAYGFRNPATWEQTDVALLGDSLIYGHGVEEDETVAHFLREDLGLRVTNLGQTGATFPDYVAFLRNFALPLGPKVAVVFVFCNDLKDLRERRTPAEVRRFVEEGAGPEMTLLPRDELIASASRTGRPAWRSLKIARAATYAWHRLEPPTSIVADRARAWASAEAGPTEAGTGRLAFAEAHSAEFGYMERAFAVMAESASAHGAQLVVSRIQCLPHTEAMYLTNELIGHHLEAIAKQLALPYFDPTLEGPDGRALPGTRLPDDGHLTETGHRLLAASLAAFLRDHGMLRGADPRVGLRD